jgi:hypothetical protein
VELVQADALAARRGGIQTGELLIINLHRRSSDRRDLDSKPAPAVFRPARS